MGHLGTHIDTYHKKTIPLEYFCSEALIFDVRELKEVQTTDIDLNLIRADDVVLFRTGCIERNPYGEKAYFDNHPQLSQDLIENLLRMNIRFIGIDAPGIRNHSEHEAADRLCEQHGVYVIENLKNLERIPQERCRLFTMWLEDEIMTGLKCRVIADI